MRHGITEKFGFSKSNVKFIEGYIELLEDYNIERNSLDVVVSNCVINLCFDKKKYFKKYIEVYNREGSFTLAMFIVLVECPQI